jgi:hypothetical protein
MNFKLGSKNTLGVALLFVLVILFSQAKYFNFFIDTPLGRLLFIAILLILSYVHKIFGAVAILMFVIAFNNSNIHMMEGFTDPSGNTGNTHHMDKDKKKEEEKHEAERKEKEHDDIKGVTTPAQIQPTTNATSTLAAIQENVSTKAQEGFDIVGKERNIQKGKNSNAIPVSDFMRESPSVAPYEGSSFAESFSLY